MKQPVTVANDFAYAVGEKWQGCARCGVPIVRCLDGKYRHSVTGQDHYGVPAAENTLFLDTKSVMKARASELAKRWAGMVNKVMSDGK